MKKIVIDEAVSEELGRQFLSFLRKKGYDGLDILYISKDHTGMPDSHIVHHLLDHSTFFLTTDRPLHNAIIAQGLKSYHCSHGKFFSKKIKGIKNKVLTPLKKEALVLKDNYHPPKTEIRPYLLPSAEKTLHENFSDIKFIPSTKGRFIERLRTKLEDSSAGSSNEIVPGYMPAIIKKMRS